MEMLNDQELAQMEAMYVKAHRRIENGELRDDSEQKPTHTPPVLAVEAELEDMDDFPRGADFDEPRESAGGERSDSR